MTGRGERVNSGGWGGGGQPPGAGGGRPQEGAETGDQRLPKAIWNGLQLRKRNKKMVQLGFEKTKELPDEDTFWDWLVKEGLADQPGIDMDFIDREVIERKYYICMKEEEGTKWLVKQFEKGVFYNDNNNVDHLIKARQMGEIWKTITV